MAGKKKRTYRRSGDMRKMSTNQNSEVRRRHSGGAKKGASALRKFATKAGNANSNAAGRMEDAIMSRVPKKYHKYNEWGKKKGKKRK